MYKKEFYVFADRRPLKATIRPYAEADFPELIRIQQESFPPPFPSDLWWTTEQLQSHIDHFPQGALCVEADGELAGSMTALRVRFDPSRPEHTWAEMTDNGFIRNHDPEGDTLYIVDLCVRPARRKLGLGFWLMQAMCHQVIRLGAKRLLGGARMPGYRRHAAEMTPQQYAKAVLDGRLNDPVVSFLLRCGRTPVQVVENYLDDEDSGNCALLMEWRNPYYAERD